MKSLVTMNRLASHRGPDGEGYWLYDGNLPGGKWIGERDIPTSLSLHGQVGLGHRRLAIIDLSDAGLQPMSSPSRQQWIVLNGEIYNYLELRAELIRDGHIFHTDTDTEVVLVAYLQWGSNCFDRFNGMWGMAIVDLAKRVMLLSRDRLGVKPLYYWFEKGQLTFASEIKQFIGMPGFSPRANLDAVIEYIDTGYEIPPETFFRDVRAFPPGSFAEFNLDPVAEPQAQRFWNFEPNGMVARTQADAMEQLRFLFEDSVRLRLRSDVPVGVCLSGGLDSSLVYGQIQNLVTKRESTNAFTASYKEKQFDESPYVRLVLDKFGGQVHYTYPDAQSFLDDFDAFIYQHDEPPGAISQYAAWAVMRLARQNQVPVLLNGQGGDELFSGYWPAYYLFLRHNMVRSPWKTASHLFGAMLPGGNVELIKQIPAHFRQYLVRRNQRNLEILSAEAIANSSRPKENWASQAQQIHPENYRWGEISRIHLPRLLKWDDRNSMAFAIEGRYPFLDYRMVEFAMQLPVAMNFHAGWNKYLLRTSLGHLLPRAIQWRHSKIGFVTPQSVWMKTSLKKAFLGWAKDPSPLLRTLINHRKLAQIAQELLSSKSIHPMNENQHLLFRLFAIDAWMAQFSVGL